MWSTTTRTRLKTTVLLAVCAAGSMLGCDRDSAARGPAAGTPRVVDHPLLHLGRNGHLAGPPVAVAGVRCFRQIPRPRGEDAEPRVEWFSCIPDAQIWTVRRVDVAGATVKILGTEFLGRPSDRLRHQS